MYNQTCLKLDQLPEDHTSSPSQSLTSTLIAKQKAFSTDSSTNVATAPFGLLYWWLTFCSYTSKSIFWRIIMLISILVGLGSEYASAIWKDYRDYDHIVEIAYVLSTIFTFIFLQRNLNSNGLFCDRCKHENINVFLPRFSWKFSSYVVICIMLFSSVRFSIFTQLFCDESKTWDHIVGHIAAFYVNMVTMYTLDFVICNICLAFIKKFEQLKAKIKNQNDFQPDEIKKLQEQISAMVNRWLLAVSLSLFYHLFYPTVIACIWLFTSHDHLWQYCYSDSWTQLIVIIVRGVVRIYTLLYGILSLNHEYDALATIVSTESGWTDAQSTKSGRMDKNLSNKYDRFKVFWCINLKWKHLTWAIIIWILLTFAATAVKMIVEGAIVRF